MVPVIPCILDTPIQHPHPEGSLVHCTACETHVDSGHSREPLHLHGIPNNMSHFLRSPEIKKLIICMYDGQAIYKPVFQKTLTLLQSLQFLSF